MATLLVIAAFLLGVVLLGVGAWLGFIAAFSGVDMGSGAAGIGEWLFVLGALGCGAVLTLGSIVWAFVT